MPETITHEWLSLSQVAQELDIHEWTVRQYVKQGKLEGYKVGNRLRFTRAQVDAFLDSCRTVPDAPKPIPAKPVKRERYPNKWC